MGIDPILHLILWDADTASPTCVLTSAAAATVIAPYTVTATFYNGTSGVQESVTGLAVGEIVVTNGAASGLAGSGAVYTFTVTPAADGAVTVQIPAGVCQDPTGNLNTASNVLSRTADVDAPTCVISSSDPVETAFTLTITFSKAVSGFTASDITVTGGTKGALAGSGADYTIPITPAIIGSVVMQIPAAVCVGAVNGVANEASNELTVTAQLDLNFSVDTLAEWTAPTFSISSNKAVNNPTLGSDLFDAGKGTFDSGTGSWTALGSNTIANVANELEITYVNNADGAELYLRNSADLSADIITGRWYELSLSAYRSGGNVLQRLYNYGNGIINDHVVSNTSPATFKTAFQGNVAASNTHRLYCAGMAAGEKGYFDNITLQQITLAEVFAIAPMTLTGNGVVKAKLAPPVGNITRPMGIFMCLDSAATPANYVYACLNVVCNFQLQLVKVVAGVPTLLVSQYGYTAGAWTEIRRSGNSFELWHNGARVGSAATISDAGIVNNNLCGLLNTGGGVGGANYFFAAKS